MADEIVARLNHIIDEKISSQQPLFDKFFTHEFLGYIEQAIEHQADNIKVLGVDIGHYRPQYHAAEYNITSFDHYKQFIYDGIEKINSMGFRYQFENKVFITPRMSNAPNRTFDQITKNEVQYYSFEIEGTYNPPSFIKNAFQSS